MAEFQEVMREWARMLDAHRHKESIAIEALVQADAFKDAKLVEEIVMSWAAEHPEPIYPTWGEWLQEQGVLDVEYIPSASRTTSTSKSYIQTVKALTPFYRPIPADIARKLGITPKENN